MELLQRLQTFPSLTDSKSDEEYDKEMQSLVEYVKGSMEEEYKSTELEQPHLLEDLDPSTHSAAFVLVLYSHITHPTKAASQQVPLDLLPGRYLWVKAVQLLTVFDAIQVRYVGQEWRFIVESIVRAAELSSKPILAIRPVRNAILRLDPSGSSLTSSHLLFIQLCLQCKSYAAALPVIENDICYIPAHSDQTYLRRSQSRLCSRGVNAAYQITAASGLSTSLGPIHYLQYFLYTGMLYLGLKKWQKALHALEAVMSAPLANSTSIIMVEAYKKWILANLLNKGNVPSFPSYVPGFANKAFKALARPYDALGEVFKLGNVERLHAEIEAGLAIWQKDNNTGLVLQLLDSAIHRAFRVLGDTFAAITLEHAKRRLLADIPSFMPHERLIFTLVTQHQLHARLVHQNSQTSPTVLRFTVLTTSNALGEQDASMNMYCQWHRLRKLLETLHGTQRKLSLGSEYVEYLKASLKKEEARGESVSLQGGPLSVDLDEDMMKDLH